VVSSWREFSWFEKSLLSTKEARGFGPTNYRAIGHHGILIPLRMVFLLILCDLSVRFTVFICMFVSSRHHLAIIPTSGSDAFQEEHLPPSISKRYLIFFERLRNNINNLQIISDFLRNLYRMPSDTPLRLSLLTDATCVKLSGTIVTRSIMMQLATKARSHLWRQYVI